MQETDIPNQISEIDQIRDLQFQRLQHLVLINNPVD